jgi:DNA-binding LacI/PurR family transcriptional regulator
VKLWYYHKIVKRIMKRRGGTGGFDWTYQRGDVKKTSFNKLARVAKVSVATVSRVANGSAHVSPELRGRILKAAAKLGVSLSGKCRPTAKVIAFLLCNREVLHLFHSHVLAGAEAYCALQDYGLLFLSFRYSPDTPWKDLHLPEITTRRDVVRAAIVAGTNSQNLLTLLDHVGMPFVVLGNNMVGEWRSEEHNVVSFDDIEGARELTRYLLSLGHRDIWFVGSSRLPWLTRRYEGYCQIMEEAGLHPHFSDFETTNVEEIGYLGTKSILRNAQAVSAIFAGDDNIARGAYRALRQKGLRIPEDISVAGFGDMEAAALHPQLTSIRVFQKQIGASLAKVVIEGIERPDRPPRQWVIPTELIKRDSCGPFSPKAPPDEGSDKENGALIHSGAGTSTAE